MWNRQTWTWCAREEANYQVTARGCGEWSTGCKAFPSRSTGHRDLTSDVVRRWEQVGKVPGKENTEAAPEGREEGGRVNQREQGRGQKQQNSHRTGERRGSGEGEAGPGQTWGLVGGGRRLDFLPRALGNP